MGESMREEPPTTQPSGLWLYEESAIIGAESHDPAGFVPEILRSKGLVSQDWRCLRVVRGPAAATVDFDRVRWHMTQQNLWITRNPAQTLDTYLEEDDAVLAPTLARNFLNAFPDLPTRRFWFYWKLYADVPDPLTWLVETFLNVGWQHEFVVESVTPQVMLTNEDFYFQIAPRIVEQGIMPQSNNSESVSFDCYVSRGRDLTISEMVDETDFWLRGMELTKDAISQMLNKG